MLQQQNISFINVIKRTIIYTILNVLLLLLLLLLSSFLLLLRELFNSLRSGSSTGCSWSGRRNGSRVGIADLHSYLTLLLLLLLQLLLL